VQKDAHLLIEVSEASGAEKAIVANLMQFYRYDIGETRGNARQDVSPDGRYPTDQYFERYWTDPECHPFLIRVAGNLAGFVLVRERSQLTGAADVRDITEFFVMRKYRQQRVGAEVACHIFDRFPGKWEVRQFRMNHDAQAFWRRVIATYMKGQFTEITWDDDHHHGIVQRFETPKA